MLAALIPALLPILGGVLDRVIPDPEARAKAQAELFGALQSADLKQLDVNAAEASSAGIFKGGWRPAVGWVCALALAWQYLVQPFAFWIAAMFSTDWMNRLASAPKLDNVLWELLFGMLGMGALRSFEKLKGKA